ncbi:MAG: formylglycine-generating enzyme family protein [Paludibacteraceae bacterium]|nr:formylglycine-generating enzyme family protein [Paludibacteraceae bacterium]
MKTKTFTSILLFLLLFVATHSMAQTSDLVRVAILETVDKEGNVDYAKELLLRQTLTFAINRTQGYEGYNRVDMKQITGEHNFQRTGMVSDDQIKRVGVMTGAKYILIAEAANYSNTEILVLANLVDIESGKIVNSSIPKVTSIESEALTKSCIDIAKTLLNIGGGMPSASYSSSSSYSHTSTSSYGNNSSFSSNEFTETAWGINMKMIRVEGGDFLMGCTSEQGSCESDEQNVRRVTVDGFYIGMLEVTQSQWEKVMGTSIYQQWTKAGNSGTPTRGVGPDYPMYCVSWEEAMEFCRVLSNKTGRTYTLPTEAQWEYAARGGNRPDGTKYAGSNMIDAVAWYDSNSGGSTHIVGSKRANALGIYDMSGNVWEWCKDWYANSYVSYDTNNPMGPSSGSNRVLRGGGWYNNAQYCRVAFRNSYAPSFRGDVSGFRLILVQ